MLGMEDIMPRGIRRKFLAHYMTVIGLCVCFLCAANALGGEPPPAPKMPSNWKVIFDFHLPAEQVKEIGTKLGANLHGVRNTVYDVNGKRIQINVIVTTDQGNAEKLMARLRSMKAEEALLQKKRTVYEFVGQNDVLSLIAEGRKYLDSK